MGGAQLDERHPCIETDVVWRIVDYIELQGDQNVAIAMQVANIAAVEPEMPQLPFGLVPTEGEQFVLHGPNDYPELGITGCYEVTIEAVPAAENPEA